MIFIFPEREILKLDIKICVGIKMDLAQSTYSPLDSIFSSYPEVNPIEAVAESLAKTPLIVEYGIEGLVTSCESDIPCSDTKIIKADSLVFQK